jgi:S1-C subfamily serine protease
VRRLGSVRTGLLAATAGVAVATLLLGPELETLRTARRNHESALTSLEAQLVRLGQEQDQLLSRLATQDEVARGREQDLARLREQLASASQRQGLLGADLDGLRSEFRARTAALVQRSEALDAELERRATEAHAQPAVEPSAERAAERAELRRHILRPVFQLAGAETVGSAVLVHEDEDDFGVHQYALTSYHVVRDILAGQDSEGIVLGYVEDDEGQETAVACRLLAHDVPTDLALLRVDGAGHVERLARIAPRHRDAEIEVFSPVYTVGCPLGTAAQATRGEVTRRNWSVGGEELWMVSSPAYFGNSGGGVFLEETQELIGVFAKIYTHGSYRPQVVTHMGLAVPLTVLHDWIEEVGYGFLLPEPAANTLALASEASHAAEATE